jgi:hypothetical protein
MEIVSSVYDGKQRRLHSCFCKWCGVEFFIPYCRKRIYCSRQCFELSATRNIEVLCEQCGKRCFKKPSALKNNVHRKFFCSRQCKDIAQSFDGGCEEIRPNHYKTGRASYRQRALRKYGASCRRCGYKEIEKMLDVHHKDGNRAHNQISNLEVLCVWCHALYTRKILGSSPNCDGTSLAPRNNVG